MSIELLTESQKNNLRNRGYRIITKINEGSYAKIYLGEFISKSADNTHFTTTQLAVKVLDLKRRPRHLVNKFVPRELSILSQIEHPHIIHIHSILQIGVKFYIFMRLAENGDLLDFILKNGILRENLARVWTQQMASAIQYLHQMNIAHRDLKCENILVTKNYNIKLSDFGFARFTVDENKRPVFSETYCGTLTYAPPEILHGRAYNPKMSDLWSLGVIIFVMLNKSLPFEDKNAKLLYENQCKRNYRFRTKVIDSLSNEVKLLIENLLEPVPQKRCNIENVLKSDWIAMDKRLQTLTPLELDALAKVIALNSAQPIMISLPTLKSRGAQRLAVDSLGVIGNLSDIKAYRGSNQPEKSDNLARTTVPDSYIERDDSFSSTEQKLQLNNNIKSS